MGCEVINKRKEGFVSGEDIFLVEKGWQVFIMQIASLALVRKFQIVKR